MKLVRYTVLAGGFLLLWQLLVTVTAVPPYILPGPLPVLRAITGHIPVLSGHLLITLTEILLGLSIGTILGSCCALVMIILPMIRPWMLPILVVSQAIPVFALAPLLVLWFGYGMPSKVAMAVLIIFFPVTSSFYYGMRRTDPDILDLASIMGARPLNILRHILIPSALPSFASGVRVAAAVAPIGAVVGEWVGSSAGLGFYMLHSNARMQTDLMFAALTLLSLTSVILYFSIDSLMNRLLYWEKTTHEDY